MTEPFDRTKARTVLLQLADLLDSIGLRFFLIQGTALGAYRDGDFVEGEKDIDIGVLYEDFAPVRPKLIRKLLEWGAVVNEVNRPFQSVRSLKVIKDDIPIDLVGWMPWSNLISAELRPELCRYQEERCSTDSHQYDERERSRQSSCRNVRSKQFKLRIL